MKKLTLLKIVLFCVLPSFAFGQTIEKEYEPLLESAKKSNSDALVVLEDGKEVVEYYSDSESQKIQSMSVTKSVVGLAFAKLLSDGIIDSLNTPVAHYFPEWRQGQKKEITIQHLLNHTSGLQNKKIATKEVNPAPDKLQLGLSASVVSKPGTEFSYNNKSVNILPAIIKKITGKPIDDYLGDNLFNKMEISDYHWGTDQKGNHAGMAGLEIHGYDLAKLGQLVLQKGSWNGEQLIDEKWIDAMLNKTPQNTETYGLLWWGIPKNTSYVVSEEQINNMKEANVPSELISKINSIKGEYNSQSSVVNAIMGQFDDRKQLARFRKATLGQNIAPYDKSVSGPIIGYKASGDGGQYLVIYPEENVVAVRMVQKSNGYNQKTDLFGSFPNLIYKLAN